MIRAVRQKKRKKRRIVLVGLLIVLLAAAGTTLQRLSLSLQDISRIIQLAAGKISKTEKHLVQNDSVLLRGTIYDRSLTELSVSYQLFSLYIHPVELSDRKKTAHDLAEVLGQDQQFLAEQLKQLQPVVTIADDLDEQQAKTIQKLHLDGVYCKLREERYYPGHTTAAAMLGFTDKGIGLSGVEAIYDPILHPGALSQNDFPEIDFAGDKNFGQKAVDVILTLDQQLQKKIEKQLEQYRKDTGAARAMAIAMEPGTGKIFAMVSQPGFDPNYFWHADEQAIKGQLVQKQYLAALIWPFFKAAVEIYDAGMNAFALPVTVKAPEQDGSHQKTEKFWQLFAMDAPVSWPFANSTETIADNGAIGQDERITGGQLAVGLASLINGGKRVAPYVMDRVYDHDKEKFYARMRNSKGTRRIIDPAQGVHLRMKLLKQPYFTHGKGFVFSNRVARVLRENNATNYYNQEFFIGGMPRKRPKVILVMAVDHRDLFPLSPKMYQKKKNDETLSAIGRHLLPSLEQVASVPKIADATPAKSNENYQRFLISRRIELKKQNTMLAQKERTMPDVTGMSLRKGLQHINALHVQVSIVGSGRIVRQEPAAGTALSEAGVCRFFLESRI